MNGSQTAAGLSTPQPSLLAILCKEIASLNIEIYAIESRIRTVSEDLGGYPDKENEKHVGIVNPVDESGIIRRLTEDVRRIQRKTTLIERHLSAIETLYYGLSVDGPENKVAAEGFSIPRPA
jgi:hypothetical protein